MKQVSSNECFLFFLFFFIFQEIERDNEETGLKWRDAKNGFIFVGLDDQLPPHLESILRRALNSCWLDLSHTAFLILWFLFTALLSLEKKAFQCHQGCWLHQGICLHMAWGKDLPQELCWWYWRLWWKFLYSNLHEHYFRRGTCYY